MFEEKLFVVIENIYWIRKLFTHKMKVYRLSFKDILLWEDKLFIDGYLFKENIYTT